VSCWGRAAVALGLGGCWRQGEQAQQHGTATLPFHASTHPSTHPHTANRYDAIHNAHLGLTGLEALYAEAKVLADAVIPNE